MAGATNVPAYVGAAFLAVATVIVIYRIAMDVLANLDYRQKKIVAIVLVVMIGLFALAKII